MGCGLGWYVGGVLAMSVLAAAACRIRRLRLYVNELVWGGGAFTNTSELT